MDDNAFPQPLAQFVSQRGLGSPTFDESAASCSLRSEIYRLQNRICDIVGAVESAATMRCMLAELVGESIDALKPLEEARRQWSAYLNEIDPHLTEKAA